MTSENTSVEPQAKPRFRLEDHRLNQAFDQMVQVKKVTLVVPVSRPPQQQFFQVHPDPEWRAPLPLIKLKEQDETYLVGPGLYADLASEIERKLVVACVTRSGGAYLWPIKLPDLDGSHNPWHASAMAIVQEHAGKWIRVTANRELGGYDVLIAEARDLPEPVWPECGLEGLVETAFKGKIIDTADHIVIRKLRGLA